jgi:hypothetical protein
MKTSDVGTCAEFFFPSHLIRRELLQCGFGIDQSLLVIFVTIVISEFTKYPMPWFLLTTSTRGSFMELLILAAVPKPFKDTSMALDIVLCILQILQCKSPQALDAITLVV